MSDYREVDPREFVEAEVDGTWWPAELRAWRRTEAGWEGCVTYTTRDAQGLPENRLAWLPAASLRVVEETGPSP